MIFRTNDVTKYPQSVLDASSLLPGLEAITGADLLISPRSAKLSSVSDSMALPQRLIFEQHVKAGLLVQVKLGGDFLSSIPNLSGILMRMLKWTKRPWLLIVGEYHRDKYGHVNVDGRSSEWDWIAYTGAKDWWQLRGGMLTELERDAQIIEWTNGWVNRLAEIEKTPIKIVPRPVQQLLAPTASAMATLRSFEIGQERARAILDYCGTLADSLVWLSDPVGKVAGVGKQTFVSVKRQLGLQEDEALQKIVKEEDSA